MNKNKNEKLKAQQEESKTAKIQTARDAITTNRPNAENRINGRKLLWLLLRSWLR